VDIFFENVDAPSLKFKQVEFLSYSNSIIIIIRVLKNGIILNLIFIILGLFLQIIRNIDRLILIIKMFKIIITIASISPTIQIHYHGPIILRTQN